MTSQAFIPEKWRHVPTKTCTQTFIATLFVKAPRWKQPGCPASGEWVNDQTVWHMRAVEHRSAVKGYQLWIRTTTQMIFGECCRVKKVNSKRCHMNDSIYITVSEWQNYQNGEHGSCQGGRRSGDRREVGEAIKGHREASSWWWNCSTAWLNQRGYPSSGTILEFTTAGNGVKGTWDLPYYLLWLPASLQVSQNKKFN